jgi:hypothetical protein
MTPNAFRDFIREEWSRVPLPESVAADVRPGGPAGQWITISLEEMGPCLRMHFRMLSDVIEVAHGDTPENMNGWKSIDPADVPRLLRQFVEHFQETC